MSFIRVPDPHPGRCLNYRNIFHADGHVESVRCLDYEGVIHVCSFPEPSHIVTFGAWTTTPTEFPKKWVKP